MTSTKTLQLRHLAALAMLGALFGGAAAAADPAEIAIGERLFLETRFAQAHSARPDSADPALNTSRTPTGGLPGATMNCRACHLVDEHAGRAGVRSYADFARTSPVPERADGRHAAVRNAMSMVNIAVAGPGDELFHFDGEFASLEDLVRATLSGRNFGWLPGEQRQAIAHIARVIRGDDGRGPLAQEFGGAYRVVLAGTAADLPAQFRLPPQFRVDVAHAGDDAILDGVATLIAAYVRDLHFQVDAQGRYTGSPYDVFLQRNGLPAAPASGETAAGYRQRLLAAVEALAAPRFLTASEREFKSHAQPFAFGPQELAGLRLFLRSGTPAAPGGNCAACHAPPHFSDFRVHNTGLTQQHYDAVHGSGRFAALAVPDLEARNRAPRRYLTASARYPNAPAPFRAPVSATRPGTVDLGLWNVFANPEVPGPQAKLRRFLCEEARARGVGDCTDAHLLALAVAAFKTPVLRDLGHSDPYMHDGRIDTLAEAVGAYATSGVLARAGRLRNADPRLADVHLGAADIAALTAFLQALNEDYE